VHDKILPQFVPAIKSIVRLSNERRTETLAHSDGSGQGGGGFNFSPAEPYFNKFFMSKTIMIVDDSASMRQMVSFTLLDAGYVVVEARDGVDALANCTAQKVDLFISDLNMPNMDGIQLTRQLRALAPYRFTPIVMLTTESQTEKKMEGKAAGATGWVIKPFQMEQLLNVVKKVCP
jgi:two-component system chemotaxis response regulator CheY